MRSTRRGLVLLTAAFFFAISGVYAGGCDPEVPGTSPEETATDSLEIVSEDSPADSTACGAGNGGCCMMELPPLPEDLKALEEVDEKPI